MAQMTGGQAVVAALRAHEVKDAFGLISIHMMHVYDALYEARKSLRFIGCRHESAGIYMADGYARASGKPGVCFTSTGPGAANSVGAMGEAYACSSAVLNITSNVEVELIDKDRGALHEPKDQLGMFHSVTAWNALIKEVESIPDHIHEAFRRFKTQRPRPIELEIATNILSKLGEVEVPLSVEYPRPRGEARAIEEAAKLLASARRPVIWAGGGVISSGATPELVRLAELLQAPVTTTYGGKGAFPDDHPLGLGCSLGGRVYGRNPIHTYIEECDAILVVGSRLPYRATVGVGLKLPPKVVHVDIDPGVFGKNYPPTVAVQGDAKAVLVQLVEALEGRALSSPQAREAEIAQLKGDFQKALWEAGPNQQRVMETLRGLIPREGIIVSDPTVPAYWATRGMPCYEPRTYLSPHGWGGIGFAFPAALGAKVARPDKPVVVITGDGGFQLNMQELGTAAQHGINVVVLLFNDGSWGVLRDRQRDYHEGHYYATELVNPDFLQLAGAYGLSASRASTLGELARELEGALRRGAFHLIEVPLPNGFAEFK